MLRQRRIMRKKIIGSLVFFALAFVLMWKLNDAFRLKQEDGIYPMELFYEQEPGSVDVMFYGSSHTYSDINPAVIWEEQGIPSYDLAGSLQPLWNTYYYMKESLKYQRPRVMVVELVRAIESREYIEEARTVTNTFGMRLSREKIENIRVSTPDNLVSYLLGYPVYHTRYTELSRTDFASYLGRPAGDASKGFYPLFVTKPYEELADMSGVTEAGELPQKSEEYLRKIMELAGKEGIPLVFMISPYQGIIESEQQIFNRCREIAEEEGIPFLDFNQMYQELGLDPETDFAEASHLNYRGTQKLSSWLGAWLKENYELPDRRGESAQGESSSDESGSDKSGSDKSSSGESKSLYESWDENAADWNRQLENQALKEEEGWYDFLKLLAENGAEGEYTWVIALNGAYDNGEQPLEEVLLEIGMPKSVAGQGGVWLRDGEQDTALPAGSLGSVYVEFAHSDLEILTATEGGISLVYDGESQVRTLNGLNILVYDRVREELVTAAGFDAENGYQCIK